MECSAGDSRGFVRGSARLVASCSVTSGWSPSTERRRTAARRATTQAARSLLGRVADERVVAERVGHEVLGCLALGKLGRAVGGGEQCHGVEELAEAILRGTQRHLDTEASVVYIDRAWVEVNPRDYC